MKRLQRHFSRCMIAGIVALLPITGLVFSVVYLEKQLAGSWLKEQGFYFYGEGLILCVVLIYLIGLVISTFLGRWLWGFFDPLLGRIYQTLKQVLGYGEGPDAVFRRAVLVPCRELPGHEIGLVTQEPDDPSVAVTVFVPGAPNPSSGRLLVVARDELQPLNVPVTDVLKCLVSIGALPLEEPTSAAT